MRRILSGIKPTGRLHLGNYFGMMKPALELQNRGEAYYFIADYHALTTLHNPKELQEYSRGVAVDFLACGLDPKKAVFFRQSDVPEVCELTWLLSTVTPMGLLERCHAYKDHVAKEKSPNHAVFAYPVLMAADILIYQSDDVPVGRDQKQHIEVARDIAIKFNNTFGEVFKIPDPLIQKGVELIPGIDGQKMSKSYNNTIEIFEDPKSIQKKIMSIKTDSTPVEEPKNPDTCPLMGLLKLMAPPEEAEQFVSRYRKGGIGYGEVKKRLAELAVEHFAEARARRDDLLAHPAKVDDVLRAGADKARAVARQTLEKARKAVGLS
jgi:tryptophanyl-tRNA synthetase